jgi:flagellar biosynthesis protein FlhB
MSDEVRPYQPTARHLRRLRGRGWGPHASAARGSVLVAAGLVGLALAHRWARSCFATAFAAACAQAAAPDRAALTGLSRPMAIGLAALGMLAAGVAVLVWLADGLWAGVGWGGRGRAGAGAFAAALSPLRLWEAGLHLTGMVAAGWAVVWALRPLATCAELASTGVLLRRAAGAGALLALLLAGLDIAVAQALFHARARMTRQELLEEAREVRGPGLTAPRRLRRLGRRRRA